MNAQPPENLQLVKVLSEHRTPTLRSSMAVEAVRTIGFASLRRLAGVLSRRRIDNGEERRAAAK